MKSFSTLKIKIDVYGNKYIKNIFAPATKNVTWVSNPSEHTIYSKDINNTSPYRNNSEQSKHSSCTNVHKTENSGEETPGLYNYASLCPLHVEQALKQEQTFFL